MTTGMTSDDIGHCEEHNLPTYWDQVDGEHRCHECSVALRLAAGRELLDRVLDEPVRDCLDHDDVQEALARLVENRLGFDLGAMTVAGLIAEAAATTRVDR